MDGAQAAPIDPWLNVYYMVTGRNVRGELINDGQQITRQEAVWLYTGGNGWFSRDEQQLGTIGARPSGGSRGARAPTCSTRSRCPDEAIRRVHSVLTFLGGRIVHGSAAALAP